MLQSLVIVEGVFGVCAFTAFCSGEAKALYVMGVLTIGVRTWRLMWELVG